MKLLVTGANGQLGNAMQKLKKDGFYLSSSQLDVTNFQQAREVIRGLSPDIIINFAAWTDVDAAELQPDRAMLVNKFGPANLTKISQEFGSRLIHISTDYVFSGEGEIPWNVFDQVAPQSVYGKSKAEGEAAILKAPNSNSLILRTSWLFSQYRKNFVKTMVRLALTNDDSVKVVNDQFGQPTSAVDLANQILKVIANNLQPGIYHATNSGQTTWKVYAQEIFTLVGADPSRVVGIKSTELNRPAPRPKYSVLSQDCWADTGIAPMRNWREALAEQIDEIKGSVIKEGLL